MTIFFYLILFDELVTNFKMRLFCLRFYCFYFSWIILYLLLLILHFYLLAFYLFLLYFVYLSFDWLIRLDDNMFGLRFWLLFLLFKLIFNECFVNLSFLSFDWVYLSFSWVYLLFEWVFLWFKLKGLLYTELNLALWLWVG